MADTISSDSIAQDQLRAFIQRIERLEEEKKAIADDIKEIYAEAKGNGFDTKVLRQIIRIRKMDHNERMEQEALLDLYMGALGMAPMPLFDDEDDGPPRGGRRQPEYRADATGLRTLGSVASGIVANLEHISPPAQTVPSVEAERQPDNTEIAPSASAAEAETVPSKTVSARIQPETADQSTAALMEVSPERRLDGGDKEAQADIRGERSPPAGSNPEPSSQAGTQAPPVDTPSLGSVAATTDHIAEVSNMVGRSHNPETHFLNSKGLLRLHGCLKGETCGSTRPRERLCFSCSVVHDAPTYEPEAAVH